MQDNEDNTLLEDFSIDSSIDSSTKSPSPRLRGKNSTKQETLHETKKDNISVIVIISILSTLFIIMTLCGIIYLVKFKNSKIENFAEKKTKETKTKETKTNETKTNESKPLHRIPKKRNMIPKKKRNITKLPPIEVKKRDNSTKIVKEISETKVSQLSKGLLMLED